MLIAAAEGSVRVFEVVAEPDGYMVQGRDIETGEIRSDDCTLFRTMPAALAYADMAAAADRYAATGLEDEERAEMALDLKGEVARFAGLRLSLRDDGVTADMLARSLAKPRKKARRLH
ncbi:MAG: hypothetical protein ACK50Q_17590 [Labrys sp. (in: a-proteobacteria)]